MPLRKAKITLAAAQKKADAKTAAAAEATNAAAGVKKVADDAAAAAAASKRQADSAAEDARVAKEEADSRAEQAAQTAAAAAEAKAAGPKLHYFPLNGRGDFVKILFEDAAAPYTFVPHSLGGHKALTFLPYGQLPVLEDQCGHVTAQTGAIVRLVARKLNQYPSNPYDAARAESVADQCYDAIAKYFGNLFGSVTTDDLKTYLTTQWGHFEKILSTSESKGEYVTKGFTFADLQLWQLVQVASTVVPVAHDSLLAKHHARISARPHVAAYLASSRWIKPGLPARPSA